jgi:hypothetical protein
VRLNEKRPITSSTSSTWKSRAGSRLVYLLLPEIGEYVDVVSTRKSLSAVQTMACGVRISDTDSDLVSS